MIRYVVWGYFSFVISKCSRTAAINRTAYHLKYLIIGDTLITYRKITSNMNNVPNNQTAAKMTFSNSKRSLPGSAGFLRPIWYRLLYVMSVCFVFEWKANILCFCIISGETICDTL